MSHSFTVDVKGRNALKASSGKKLVPDAAGWSANVPQGIFRSAVLRVVPALHVFETLRAHRRRGRPVQHRRLGEERRRRGRHRHGRRRAFELDLRPGTTYPSVPSKCRSPSPRDRRSR